MPNFDLPSLRKGNSVLDYVRDFTQKMRMGKFKMGEAKIKKNDISEVIDKMA